MRYVVNGEPCLDQTCADDTPYISLFHRRDDTPTSDERLLDEGVSRTFTDQPLDAPQELPHGDHCAEHRLRSLTFSPFVQDVRLCTLDVEDSFFCDQGDLLGRWVDPDDQGHAATAMIVTPSISPAIIPSM